MSQRLLLPFIDDSTLFFAIRMRDLLRPLDCQIDLAWLTDKTALSQRQLAENLPEGPDLVITNPAFKTPRNFDGYDAIVTSRIYGPLRDMMKRVPVKMSADRPVVVSFQGGLDFTPLKGFANRETADAVFIVPASDIPKFHEFAKSQNFGWQHVEFGHPSFIRPATLQRDSTSARDIYFFAQAISPISLKARRHIVDVLCVLAKRNPDRDVYIKLRHLPGENKGHLHLEKYNYPDLLRKYFPSAPPNLKVTACTMDEALERSFIGITCTSTAAIDLVRAGVPTQVYLDYVENYMDPLHPPMRQLFESSNLIASLTEVMEGVTRTPDQAWLEDMFCPDDLGNKVLSAINSVRQNAMRVTRTIPPLPDPTGSS